jgi:hypothetical protein
VGKLPKIPFSGNLVLLGKPSELFRVVRTDQLPCTLFTMAFSIVTVPYSRLTKLRNGIAASWKWILSFRRADWQLDDYPIRVAKLERDSPFRSPRFKEHDFRASIINWPVMGSGNSPEEALDDLRVNFESIKSAGTINVRPGARPKIELASQAKISAYDELSQDFVQKVLGLQAAWVSDESSLWDFHTGQTNESFYAKIREIYDVDVSDVESARLWEILERIERRDRHRGTNG